MPRMNQDQPSSPATGHRLEAQRVVDDGLLPRPPTPSVVVSALVVGVVVTAFSTLLSSAVFSIRFMFYPSSGELSGLMILVAASGVALVVYVRRWMKTLAQFNRDPARWRFLVVPGFLVLGGWLGFLFVEDAYRNTTPAGVVGHICPVDKMPVTNHRLLCETAAQRCLGRVPTYSSLNTFKDCVREESLGAFPL